MADGSLIFDTRLDDKGLKSGLERLGGVGKAAMLGIGTAIAGASAALAGFGAYATKVGSGFSASMSEVAAISGATGEELRLLTARALEMGSKTKFSASESADALKYLALAGWDANQSISALPKVLNLAQAGGLNLAYASDLVTDSMSALGLSFSDLDIFVDQLAITSSKANTSVAQLGEGILTVGGTAKSLSGGTRELNTALGILADNGIKGSEGGTALRNAILALSAPTDTVAKYMKDLGLEVADASGKMRPLAEIMGDLDNILSDMTEMQKTQVLNNIFKATDLKSINALMGTSVERWEELGEAIENSSGAAEKMGQIMNDNLSGDIAIMKSALEGLGIAAFQGLDTPLRSVTQNITGYIDELAKSMLSVDDIRQQMLDAGASIEFVNNELSNMDTSKMIGGFEGLAVKLGDVIASLLTDIISQLPRFLELGIQIIQLTVNGINESLPTIIPAAISMIGILISGIAQTIPLLIDSATQIVSNLAKFITDNSSGMVASAIDLIMIIGESIISATPVLIGAAISIILALVDGLMNNLPMIIETVPKMINDFSSAIYSQLPTLVMAGIQIILMIAQGLIQAIPTLIANIPQIILAIVNVFTLYNWISIGNNLIIGIKNGALAFKGNIVSAIKGIGTNIYDSIRYVLNGGSVKLIGQNMFLAIKEGALFIKNLAVNSIKTVATSITDGVKSILSFEKFKVIGDDVVKGIGHGILNAKDWIWGVVTGFATDILDGFKSFFKIKSPSRVMRDEVGKPIVEGIAVGIEREQSNLNKTIISMSEEMLGKAKEEAKDYKEVGSLYSQFMKEGIEKNADKSINAVTKLVNDQMGAYIEALESQKKEVSKAYSRAKNEEIKTINKENEETIKAYEKAGKEVIAAYTAAINDGVKEVQKEITAEVQRITAEAQKQYDEIIKKKEDMQSKLADFGELFIIDKESGQAVIQNINEQIDAIQRYDEVLSKLKNKGASDEFLQEVTKLGIEEGTKFGQALLELTDNQFEQYQSKWNEKQKLARDVASKFYKDQLDTLEADFVNKLDASLKNVPKIVENVGINAIQGMIDGMDSRKGAAIGKAREIADAIIAEMKRAMDIHSPSRVMRDLIGKNIVKGIEVGIDEEKRNLINKMKSLVEISKEEMSMKILGGSKNPSRHIEIHNTNDKGVKQEINIYQPVKSPAEMMREAKRIGKELAYG